jgi:ubiquinone/menaquinone biosynthesis C-methylase UbiE
MADKSYKFWNRMARRYANVEIADQGAYLEKLRVMKEHLDHRANVLEIGCGTGSTALLLAPHTRHYLATDYSLKMIEIGRAKAQAAAMPNLEFQCLAVDELDIVDDSLDVVIAMSILHLLKDWQGALARAFTMLKPGGVLFSSTACIADMNSRYKHLAPLSGFLNLLPVLTVFSQEELVQGMTDAGFKIFHQWQPGDDKAIFIAAVKPPQS